jgi:hypothetical protein
MDSGGEDILEYPFTVTPAEAGVQRRDPKMTFKS